MVLTALLAALSASHIGAQSTPLAAPYSPTLGDIAAWHLSEFLKLRPAPIDRALVTYEPATGTIDVEVFGAPSARGKTDEARSTLGGYWEFIQQAHIPYVERRFKIKLTAQHYRLMYYDTQAQGAAKVILQFVNGQYVIP